MDITLLSLSNTARLRTMLSAPFTLAAGLSLLVATVNADDSSSTNSSDPNVPPLPPTGNSTLVPYAPAVNSQSFVTARNGKLYLDGQDYTFATFNNPSVFDLDDYELEDVFSSLAAFGRPITRSYTLGVTSVNIQNSSAFVIGWSNDTQDWIYNEAKFNQSDSVLYHARKWGCKLTVPVINQDYGTEDTNYNGNWADLIRLYYGLPTYNSTKSIDFWTDENLINATKKLYTKFLTRKNHLNGIVYGEDNTFWAIETGNELNQNMTKGAATDQPAPGKWTAEIAEHIKSLAPNILVMDGSLSRNNQTENKWAQEALTSPYVDLFSYHYYDVENGQLPFYDLPADAAYISSYGKTFIVGEHGFYPYTSQWDYFYSLFQSNPVAGAMAWGTRGHSRLGGFITHGEGNGIFSYHFPGWSPPATADFDPLEAYIVGVIYVNSYTIVGEAPSGYPVPSAPTILPVNTTSTANGTKTVLPFQGGAWAEHYELFRANTSAIGFNGTSGWAQVANYVRDDVDAGQANFSVEAAKFGDGNGSWVMRGVGTNLQKGPWSNVVTI